MSTTPPPLSPSSTGSSARGLSPDLSASALLRYRRQYRQHRNGRSAAAVSAARTVAFVAAVLSSLCAGSVTVFSLYGHIFQERLHYSQFQVNGVAIAASIACYLPVPLLGYVCDRAGPAPLSLLSSVLFGLGYGTAAVLYRRAATEATTGAGAGAVVEAGPTPRAYASMVAAFVAIGAATCAMYLGAVTTCAKNFGRGRHRGLALSAPIAAFGLSGMWQSQFGSRVLYERLPPLPSAPPSAPPRRGDVDVFAFFLFLAVLLFVVGLVGTFTLRVVDEDKLIDEAVEQLERSGVLDGSGLFFPSAPAPAAPAARSPSPAGPADPATSSGRSTRFGPGVTGSSGRGRSGNRGGGGAGGYGTIVGRANPFDPGHAEDDTNGDDTDEAGTETSSLLRNNNKNKKRRTRRRGVAGGDEHGQNEDDALASRLLDPSKDDEDDEAAAAVAEDEAEARALKTWVLNAETRRFLTDHTMWLLALAFFLTMGPGEAYINNMGTVLQTLYPPPSPPAPPAMTATQVSIFGMTSTVARLLTGSLTDWLAPQPQTQHLQVEADAADVANGADGRGGRRGGPGGVTVSRIALLLAAALVLSAGLAVLASGAVQNHGRDRFWLVSGLVGAGYGAVFSVTPIVITVIWGVENFGTNWGIVAMFPALGATLWGLVYSAVYQRGTAPGGGNLCYGTQCYAPTFWAMAGSVWVACVLVLAAWKGRRGWAQRGIVI